jgi:transcriptional regulator of acetoin/glycerol metabolism
MELTAREDPATTPTGPGPVVETKSGGGTLNIAVECATREAVEKALAQSNGNVAEAAAALGILRTSLYRIMKRYGIATPSCSKGRSQT